MRKRSCLIALLLLPGCAGIRGEDFTPPGAGAGEVARCALAEAGRLGYRVTQTSPGEGVSSAHFRAERWLRPSEGSVRSLGVLTVQAWEDGRGRTRVRVVPERFEAAGAGSGWGGGGLGGPQGGSFPEGLTGVPGGIGRPTPLDTAMRRTPQRSGMRRVTPGPVAHDAGRVRAQCSGTAAESRSS